MIDKDNVSGTISPKEKDKEKLEVIEKNKKDKEENYYEQPPSDSENDTCGPLNCDKEL